MSGSIFDMLSDPAFDALAGAAQGFGQAAMPSRMPVPFGAALGMGLGGAVQGARESAQLQQLGAQDQAAQIANQRSRMLMNWYQGQSPFGAPSGSGQGGGAGAGGSSATTGGGGTSSGSGGMAASIGTPPPASGQPSYLLSPQALVSRGDLALATGNDSAAATLYAQPNSMAGGAGYAMGANGTAFAVPGGAASLPTIAQKAYAEAQGKMGPDLATKGFTMTANGLAPIPGGPADPNYIGQADGAKPIDIRGPGLHWDAVHGWVKNPQLITTQNPDGTTTESWATPPLPGASGGGSGGMPPATSPQAASIQAMGSLPPARWRSPLLSRPGYRQRHGHLGCRPSTMKAAGTCKRRTEQAVRSAPARSSRQPAKVWGLRRSSFATRQPTSSPRRNTSSSSGKPAAVTRPRHLPATTPAAWLATCRSTSTRA